MTRVGQRRGFRVTARDREIVRWIGRLRMVTAAQVADRFNLGRAVCYSRLSGLVKLGLLEHARIFHATPGVFFATKSGLVLVDLELPPARVDVRTYDHDVELSSLVLELEREFGRERLITEREMRSIDTPLGAPERERPKFAVPLTGSRGQMQLTPAGHPRLHFPDCAVGVGGSRAENALAIELERTPKGRTRLARILCGYIASRSIQAVRYYATTDRVETVVRKEVDRLAAGPMIEVRRRPAACASLLARTA